MAIGLIAAYAIALQALFASFAPSPAHAAGAAGWSILCFGSANTAPANDDPAAPASGTFHCVLCGSALAAAAVLPPPADSPAPRDFTSLVVFAPAEARVRGTSLVRDRQARAPPLTA